MKIIIKTTPHKFSFYLPNGFIKSTILLKSLDLDGEAKKLIKSCYPHIKKFIKANGHFNLVEIDSKDAKVIIRV